MPKVTLKGTREEGGTSWVLITEEIESWDDLIGASASILHYVVYGATEGKEDTGFTAYVLGRVAYVLSTLRSSGDDGDE